MWIFLLGTDHTYVNHPAAHIHPLIFCLCGCLLCVWPSSLSLSPPWGAVLDADLLRVTTWPTYPQTTLMDQFVCVACGQTFLTGVCWINELPRFFTIVDFSVWLSAGFLSSFLIVSNQAQKENHHLMTIQIGSFCIFVLFAGSGSKWNFTWYKLCFQCNSRLDSCPSLVKNQIKIN